MEGNMATQPTRYRFTVEDFEQMGVAGILGEDDRVELIAGEIVQMAAIGVRHATCVSRLNRLLVRTAPDDLLVHVQDPIRLGNDGEPQPDLCLVYDRHYDATPTEQDVLLVIEVSDSSRLYDLNTKLPLYAAAGIAEAWLVDLQAGIVERHTEQLEGAYRHVAWARAGDTLAAVVVPSVVIPVADMLR